MTFGPDYFFGRRKKDNHPVPNGARIRTTVPERDPASGAARREGLRADGQGDVLARAGGRDEVQSGGRIA